MESRQRSCLQRAFDVDNDFDFGLYVQQEIAGIFHPPRDVRDGELCAGFPGLPIESDRNRDGDLMLRAVHRKFSVELNRRSAGRGKRAFHFVRTKNKVRKCCALQNVLVHFRIARIVATRAAFRVHDNFAGRFACFRIEKQRTVLQRKRSVNGVHGGIKSPAHMRLRWIELCSEFPRRTQCWPRRKDEQQQECNSVCTAQ